MATIKKGRLQLAVFPSLGQFVFMDCVHIVDVGENIHFPSQVPSQAMYQQVKNMRNYHKKKGTSVILLISTLPPKTSWAQIKEFTAWKNTPGSS